MQLLREKSLPLKKHHVAVALVLIVVIGFAFYCRQHFSQSSVLPQFSPPYPFRASIEPFLPFLVPSGKQEQVASSQSSSSLGVVSSSSNSVFKVVVYGGSTSGNQFQILTPIDWSADGPITPGESRNSPKVNFRNEGNVPLRLYLSTSNWAFKDAAGNTLEQDYSQHFRLTWDYDDSEIVASETRKVTLTLNVSPSLTNVETFSFCIAITIAFLK